MSEITASDFKGTDFSRKVKAWRYRTKIRAVEYKGGKCSICNYNKSMAALQFHHIDPTQKEFGIARSGISRAWEKIKKELDKCILLCANCHAERHELIKTLS